MPALLLVFQDVRNPRQLSALETQTYMIALIVALCALGIAFLIANLIAYEGGSKPRDPVKRRMAFFVVGIVAAVAFYLYNILSVIQSVATSLQDKFRDTSLFSTIGLIVVFVVCGFALSKMLKQNKFGTVFSSKNK